MSGDGNVLFLLENAFDLFVVNIFELGVISFH